MRHCLCRRAAVRTCGAHPGFALLACCRAAWHAPLLTQSQKRAAQAFPARRRGPGGGARSGECERAAARGILGRLPPAPWTAACGAPPPSAALPLAPPARRSANIAAVATAATAAATTAAAAVWRRRRQRGVAPARPTRRSWSFKVSSCSDGTRRLRVWCASTPRGASPPPRAATCARAGAARRCSRRSRAQRAPSAACSAPDGWRYSRDQAARMDKCAEQHSTPTFQCMPRLARQPHACDSPGHPVSFFLQVEN